MEHVKSMPWHGGASAVALLLGVAALPMAQAEGLVIRSTDPLNGLYGRARAHGLPPAAADARNSLRAWGDYFLFNTAPADAALTAQDALLGGLRLSGGITATWPDPAADMGWPEPSHTGMHYVGFGYSRVWLKNQLALNADFGLASPHLGAADTFRHLWSGPSLEDRMRALRWSPVMAVGVSYSF